MSGALSRKLHESDEGGHGAVPCARACDFASFWNRQLEYVEQARAGNERVAEEMRAASTPPDVMTIILRRK